MTTSILNNRQARRRVYRERGEKRKQWVSEWVREWEKARVAGPIETKSRLAWAAETVYGRISSALSRSGALLVVVLLDTSTDEYTLYKHYKQDVYMIVGWIFVGQGFW